MRVDQFFYFVTNQISVFRNIKKTADFSQTAVTFYEVKFTQDHVFKIFRRTPIVYILLLSSLASL